MFKEAIAALGSIDILVNNAGIQKDSAFLDMSLEDWNRVIAVNLTGYFLCAREAAREFYAQRSDARALDRGGQDHLSLLGA
jgi:glucose 1-dehydrogenase